MENGSNDSSRATSEAAEEEEQQQPLSPSAAPDVDGIEFDFDLLVESMKCERKPSVKQPHAHSHSLRG